MKKTTLHTTILVSVAALLAGCAVLTVDVDVYKGPLANHEDIQTEQMAAMAIAAKPLLVELRDRLELPYKTPCPEWTKRLETENGLVREKGEGRALIWRIVK